MIRRAGFSCPFDLNFFLDYVRPASIVLDEWFYILMEYKGAITLKDIQESELIYIKWFSSKISQFRRESKEKRNKQ